MVAIYFAVLMAFLQPPFASGTSNAAWAKGAMPLRSCANPSAPGAGHLPSPDRAVVIDMECDEGEALKLRVTALGRTHSVALRDGSAELLWAPNSRVFVINGAESGYAGLFVDVFHIEPNRVRRQAIDRQVQADMVSQFPPCKAAGAAETCKTIETHPEFNVSAIAWTGASSTIILVAEVPCSSAYGGIMCQVRGYEVRAVNGQIVREMSPRQLKREYQPHMAWQLRIPDAPKYRQR